MASSVCWHGLVLRREDGHALRREDGHVLRREDGHALRREDGHVLRREDGHVLRWAFHFEIEDQWNKWRTKGTLKKRVEEESVKVGLTREDALCPSKWSVGVNHIAAGLK